MAHDGLLPGSAAKIYPRFHTPYIATIVSGIFAAALAGLFPIGLVGFFNVDQIAVTEAIVPFEETIYQLAPIPVQVQHPNQTADDAVKIPARDRLAHR